MYKGSIAYYCLFTVKYIHFKPQPNKMKWRRAVKRISSEVVQNSGEIRKQKNLLILPGWYHAAQRAP